MLSCLCNIPSGDSYVDLKNETTLFDGIVAEPNTKLVRITAEAPIVKLPI